MKATEQEITRLLELHKKYDAIGVTMKVFEDTDFYIQISEKWFAIGHEICDGTKAIVEELGFEPKTATDLTFVCICVDILEELKEKYMYFYQPTTRLKLPTDPSKAEGK